VVKYKNITLTVDEIHKIREEHYEKTKDMSFEECKAELKAEITLVLAMLESIKESKKLKEA